jgi:hypothetical protein
MMCQTPTELTSFSVCTLLHLSKALVQQRVSSAEQETRHIQKWSQNVIDVGATVDYERATHTKQTIGTDTQAKRFVATVDYERGLHQ